MRETDQASIGAGTRRAHRERATGVRQRARAQVEGERLARAALTERGIEAARGEQRSLVVQLRATRCGFEQASGHDQWFQEMRERAEVAQERQPDPRLQAAPEQPLSTILVDPQIAGLGRGQVDASGPGRSFALSVPR